MEQFEQLLTCAICLDRYRNPKLLPCQHSFCMEPCMDGLVDYVRRQVKCPECRAEHRIPYQGVQAFPTNVTLQRFLELHIEITGELPDPTSGQTMERCGVCSEKSYCSLCVHCEKKCCPECKDAHMDILRREITRINSQIRRGLHRLQDALALVEKNTLGLQTNCASVAEEVDEIYRRLSKALKDRTEHLRNEIERYSGTEIRGLIQLKENLELEIANIQSNCDLADAHINENVSWDDAELLDTKELFLRTVEFIRNFEYEAGDYGRRVRFVMAHEPNQLVLHVAGYGELNIKPETGTGGHLGTTGGLAPPGGSPGLMRSKSDHRLASQYRQQEEDRSTRNRYVPDYEYDAPEYEAPRNKSRYRSRFMRHRDGEESDGDTRSTVRFTSTPAEPSAREKVLDTEDAARGPLSGIFRLTDSPRVMKKLQECERAGKRKKEEPAPAQPPAPKPQVQVRKAAPTAMAKQVSEDDEISRIKKQNKSAPAPTETVEERQPVAPSPVHTPVREPPEREPEETTRRTPIARRTSSEAHTPGARSASSDSSTGSESSGGSGIRSTGAPFTAEEMKQKYLSKAPPTSTTTTVSSGPGITTAASRDTSTTPTSSPRPFQSRFLGAGNRAAPPPPVPAVREEPKKKEEEEDDDDEETTSSSEETESETEEESETEAHPATPTAAPAPTQERQRSESAMARTDIGPLLARSAEARRGSKEDSPSTRYTSPRGSPSLTVSSPTSTTASSTPGYTSRIVSRDKDDDVNDDKTAASASSSSSSSSSSSPSSTDRIAQDNVNALTTRDDAVALNSLEPSNNESSDSSNSSSASDSDESEETVRANNLKSNENNKNESQHNLVNDPRANASLKPTLNENRHDNNKIESNDNDNTSDVKTTKKIVKFGSNGDADSIEAIKDQATNFQQNERNKKIDGNGDSEEHDEERIDDFLARVVRDYNSSREEDTSGRARIIGSRVESPDREASAKDSIFDNAKPASTSISGISSNVQVLQENGKSYETAAEEPESGNTDSRTDRVTSDGEDSGSEIEDSHAAHGQSKLLVDTTNFSGSIDRFLGKIEEEDSSNETEPDNLTELENSLPMKKIQVHTSQAKELESNSDKTDETFVNNNSSSSSSSEEEESQDSETESEENSVRQVLDGSTDSIEINPDVTDGHKREQRLFVQDKVENLFDDNGWVVTDEDLQPSSNKETISSSIFSTQSNEKTEDNETDKTDFYNENSTNNAGNSTESDSSRSDDSKKLSTGKIEKSSSTIGNNGWQLSEESGSESETTNSPIEAINSDDIEDTSSLKISKMFLSSDEDEGLADRSSRVNSNGSAAGSLGDDHSWVFLNENETELNEGDKGRVSDETIKEIQAKGNWKEGENLPSRINGTLTLGEEFFGESSKDNNDENSEMGKKKIARTVDDDDDDDDDDEDDEEEEDEDDDDAKSNGDELPKLKMENGGSLINRNPKIEDLADFDSASDEGTNNEDPHPAPMNIPMQMVTTVFCVSVLCYSVLTNLFL